MYMTFSKLQCRLLQRDVSKFDYAERSEVSGIKEIKQICEKNKRENAKMDDLKKYLKSIKPFSNSKCIHPILWELDKLLRCIN